MMTFNSKTGVFFCLLFTLSKAVSAQKSSAIYYFNAKHDTVKTKAEANYYQLVETVGNNRVSIKYDSSDVKLVESSYSRDEKLVDADKKVMQEENRGWRLNGRLLSWYPSGQLKSECNNVMGVLQDSFKSYYPSGVLKRLDVYHKGVFEKGQCFDENQREILYFPYEINPEFIGGQRVMFQFLADNIKYPKKSRRNNEQGIVYVGFIIDKTGEVVDINVKRGVSLLIDEEALRVVKLMPKWKVGRQDGEPVRVAFTLPIKFRVE
jgi:TonB family protein